MVKGLDRLRSYFEHYQQNYIIIGGTACEIRLESKGIDFRATKDIDMLLIIEAIDQKILAQFWHFIRDGGYEKQNIDQMERKFFRFTNPQADDFPLILELFSRKPEGITVPEDFHLTPIPTSEELSYLSAMLMDDDYYNFTIQNCDVLDGLKVANELALITLKIKAYLNNLQRKIEGHAVRENDITKHKRNVLKLVATLTGNELAICPDIIKTDIAGYIDHLRREQPDIKGLTKEAGLGPIALDDILEQMARVFQLEVG